MKVYSWSILISTVLLGFIYMAYTIKGISDGRVEPVGIVLMVVLIGQGLHAALSKEGFEKEQKTRMKQKRVFGKLFGRWSSVVTWGPVVLFIVAWACSVLAPARKWLVLLLFIVGILYAIGLAILFFVYRRLADE